MSKCATVVVDFQNEYLPTGKLVLSRIEQALANAARVIDATRSNGSGHLYPTRIHRPRYPLFHSRDRRCPDSFFR